MRTSTVSKTGNRINEVFNYSNTLKPKYNLKFFATGRYKKNLNLLEKYKVSTVHYESVPLQYFAGKSLIRTSICVFGCTASRKCYWREWVKSHSAKQDNPTEHHSTKTLLNDTNNGGPDERNDHKQMDNFERIENSKTTNK